MRMGFDLKPFRPHIRRAVANGESIASIIVHVGWVGSERSFREAVRARLAIDLRVGPRTHSGTSKTAQREAAR